MPRQDEQIWRAGDVEFGLSRPKVMGILNVTPDSFSDGGEHDGAEEAIAWGLELLDEGADIIDVGGESTRPGAIPISPEVEAGRIVPVVRELCAQGAVVSVDTRHAATAKLCARLGARIINDVTGFIDPAMQEVAATTTCGLVVCRGQVDDAAPRPARARRTAYLDTDPRSRGGSVEPPVASRAEPAPSVGRLFTPSDDGEESDIRLVAERPQHVVARRHRFTLPESAPVLRQVMGFLGDRARELQRLGVTHDRIAMDPAPGFGTTVDEDVIVQRSTRQIVSMGYPVVSAVSRKRFVGAVSGVGEAAERDAASLGVMLAAVATGARIVRTHNVRAAVEALDAYWAMACPAPRRAFVGLGSNVGDREGYLARALQLLDELPMTCVSAVSNAYESEPALGIATPVVNAVAELRTELAPLVLLDHLMAIERSLGRRRPSTPNGPGPRTIDLDLLFYEGERSSTQRLALPHPGLGERDFVLAPLEDLMRDPERFLESAGVDVRPRDERVGLVRADLGPIAWEG